MGVVGVQLEQSTAQHRNGVRRSALLYERDAAGLKSEGRKLRVRHCLDPSSGIEQLIEGRVVRHHGREFVNDLEFRAQRKADQPMSAFDDALQAHESFRRAFNAGLRRKGHVRKQGFRLQRRGRTLRVRSDGLKLPKKSFGR